MLGGDQRHQQGGQPFTTLQKWHHAKRLMRNAECQTPKSKNNQPNENSHQGAAAFHHYAKEASRKTLNAECQTLESKNNQPNENSHQGAAAFHHSAQKLIGEPPGNGLYIIAGGTFLCRQKRKERKG